MVARHCERSSWVLQCSVLLADTTHPGQVFWIKSDLEIEGQNGVKQVSHNLGMVRMDGNPELESTSLSILVGIGEPAKQRVREKTADG